MNRDFLQVLLCILTAIAMIFYTKRDYKHYKEDVRVLGKRLAVWSKVLVIFDIGFILAIFSVALYIIKDMY